MWRMKKVLHSNVTRVINIACVAGFATAGYFAYNDDEIRRPLVFWAKAVPIFVHYKYIEHRIKMEGKSQEKANATYERLHNKYAPKVYSLALNLRGFYLKCAQLVSIQSEMVPPQYLTFLRTLQDNVPPEYTPHEVRTMVEKALGKPIKEVFSRFEDVPLGAASIGQVHRATMLDGREVVVKLQFPKAEQYFKSDIAQLIKFCDVAMPYFTPSLREVEKQYTSEFDYTKEAENLQIVADNINRVWAKKVRVPLPIKELCTKQVLVMEYLPGIKLVDGIRRQYSKTAAAQGRTWEELEAEQIRNIREGTVKVGPSKFQMKLYIGYIKCRDYAVNTTRFFYNAFYGRWVRSPKPYMKTELPINIPEILDVLLKVHGYEIFVNGAFNGDPHPGNILLLEDGRLGLIDYGQVKFLTKQERVKIARLILSLAKNDEEGAVRVFTEELGARTRKMNHQILLEYARFFFDADTPKSRHGFNVHQYLDYLGGEDLLVEISEDYVVASRVSLLLRGMGLAFQQHLSTAQAWMPYAKLALKNEHAD